MRILLFQLISSLSVLFTSCVIGASIIGRTQSPDPLIQRLHLSDCALPCWIGIIPGETRDTDAYQRFARIFGIGTSDLSSFNQYGFHTSFPLSEAETMSIQFQVSQSII